MTFIVVFVYKNESNIDFWAKKNIASEKNFINVHLQNSILL